MPSVACAVIQSVAIAKPAPAGTTSAQDSPAGPQPRQLTVTHRACIGAVICVAARQHPPVTAFQAGAADLAETRHDHTNVDDQCRRHARHYGTA
jgi:hypothetical protein